ncbi:Serpentine Receptor, class I [Caenorhabditis elegans]|uniref:Serpentine Receptor, class I n=1 Tax=Caenorhabditis elegans TaxID=6239 RepID=O16591_CAEEL|nr:Serpentine Receptor, class I [Caenorhabditis elegans]CCD68442.1 Serpentine Receptor, class I [Caenorhabditis elegans]|eukprot:NP_494304.1 Serpentine Receptor, class I [Caenorhabditis elegans]
MEDIDFSDPRWLLNYFHLIGLVSFILNSIGIYFLIFNTNRLGNFKYYLLLFQLSCVLTDIDLTILVQPIPLFPLFAGHVYGVLFTWFNMQANTSAVTVAFVAVIQLESLIVCFVKKHQGVAILLNKHILSKCVINALYVLCLIFPFFVCAGANSISLSREDALIYIKKVYPKGYLQFSNLPNFVVYMKSQNTIIFLVTLFFAASFGFLCLCFTIYDIIRMMADLKLRISKVAYEKHSEALRSVIIQFITAVLCMAGPMIQVLILVFEIPQMNFISELIFAWFATHSSINMVSLFIFFPPYRKIIAKGLKKTKVNINLPISSMGL